MTILQKTLYFLITTLVFCIPAFYNGFPLMFPDTAGYIYTGFENEVGYARVWLYGGFIRHVSLYESLWFVIFGQGLLLTGTLYLVFKYLFKHQAFYKYALWYTLIIGATTAASFHVSMLMPDIFTPMVILSFVLLLFAPQMSKKDFVLVVLLFVIATGMHNSHLVLNIALVLGLGLFLLIKRTRLLLNNMGLNFRKLIGVSSLILCTHLLVCTLHYSKGGAFKATRGSPIFLFARLCDFGLAQSYLEEKCALEKSDSLCNYIETLGPSGVFLWAPESFLQQSGGWTDENELYYGNLVKEILTSPKYLKKYILKSIEASFMQFFYYEMNPIDQVFATKENIVETYFPSYTLAAKNSKQLRQTYKQTFIEDRNTIQQVVLMISLLLLLLLFWDENYSKRQKAIALFILAALFANAFIVAATSGVYDRYQSRVAWLLTLPAFWFAYSKITIFINKHSK